MGTMLQKIDTESLKEIVPSVFASRRNIKMSEKYVHVRSADILETLAERGFVVTSAAQDTARERDPNYVRHELRLTHESRIGEPAKVGGTVPQIVIENSGNGRTKFRSRAGLYRYWCANGCTMGTSFETIELIHMHDAAAQVADMLERITGQFERIEAAVEAWHKIKLSRYKQTNFAKKALELRFGEKSAKAYDPKVLLTVNREMDEGDDLWHVFNRVQENVLRGGFSDKDGGRKIRQLNGITSQRDLNVGVWDLAEKMAA